MPAGTVTIQWQLENDGPDKGHLRIGWVERGGPAVKKPQNNNGFGHMIITKIVPLSLQGRASLQLESQGVRWTLVVPVGTVLAKDQA
jgi:two-component sensor histidine kinase